MGATSPSIADAADALSADGRIEEAYRLLAGARAAADPEALIRLGDWRLAGRFVRRDLAAARELFRKAAGLGHAGARSVYTAFLANGTGGARDWPGALALLGTAAEHDDAARDELGLVTRMELSPAGDPSKLPREEALSSSPRASCFRALFSPAECEFLIARARPWLAPSLVVDPQTGRQMPNPVRTSDAMAFPFVEESPAIHALNRRIAAATGTTPAQGEPLQVLRYRPGQEYKPHSDALAGDANQRVLTVLVYLNGGFEGGETRFVRTGLAFRGEPGDALVFRNVAEDGRPDPMAGHAGLPVRRGEKLIASRWIRARPFSVPPPPPLLDL